jgi:hypothetical protein
LHAHGDVGSERRRDGACQQRFAKALEQCTAQLGHIGDQRKMADQPPAVDDRNGNQIGPESQRSERADLAVGLEAFVSGAEHDARADFVQAPAAFVDGNAVAYRCQSRDAVEACGDPSPVSGSDRSGNVPDYHGCDAKERFALVFEAPLCLSPCRGPRRQEASEHHGNEHACPKLEPDRAVQVAEHDGKPGLHGRGGIATV